MNICKAFANHSPANVKLSKTKIYKIVQSGGFFGKLMGPLLKTDVGIHKKVLVWKPQHW